MYLYVLNPLVTKVSVTLAGYVDTERAHGGSLTIQLLAVHDIYLYLQY